MTDERMRELAAKSVGRKNLHGISLAAGATRVQMSMFEALTAFGYTILDIIAAEAKQAVPVDAGPVKLKTTQLNKQISELMRAGLGIGGKINAIKLIREQKGIGLREAKLYCDQLQNGMAPFTTDQWNAFCTGELKPDWLA